MADVYVRRKVRPLRFAFLVNPRKVDEVFLAMKVNTVLWCGQFNPIVPVLRSARGKRTIPRSARELVSGYLDAFEPDFVVTGSGVDASIYDIPEARTIELSAMATTRGIFETGLAVVDLYRWLYEKEFRFVHREPRAILYPTSTDPSLHLLTSTVFGRFPDKPLDLFRHAFAELGGQSTALTAAVYFDLLERPLYPYRLGSAGITERSSCGPRRTFMLVDPRSTGDLIDFWNLRAFGWRIVAVPVSWIAQLIDPVSRMIRTQHQPDRLFLPSVTCAHLTKGPSVPDAILKQFARDVCATDETARVVPLPAIWKAEFRETDGNRRTELLAGDDEVRCEVRDGSFSFDAKPPPFNFNPWGGGLKWANTIELRSNDLPTLARIIPTPLDAESWSRLFGHEAILRNSSEGLTLLTGGRDIGLFLRWPHGPDVIAEWLKPFGKVQLSGAGKIAKRLIEVLGGPAGTGLVNDVEFVRLLGDAYKSSTRDIPHRALFSTLMRLHRNEQAAVQRRIEALLQRNVFRFGIRLQCQNCGQQNWFSLEEARESLTCAGCLDELRFPTAMPPKEPCWSYRPLGPFAAQGHAHGAYVVASSIRMLQSMGGFTPQTSWIPSFTLSNSDTELEADFGILWAASGVRHNRPQFVLGECKTFDYFRRGDLKRVRALASRFPNAAIVFSTFRNSLSPEEKRAIGRFATSGRKQWRTPVIVLTARELTSSSAPPHCWARAGSDQAKLIYEQLLESDLRQSGLRWLAWATQQLYLDLQPAADALVPWSDPIQ